MSTIPQTRTTAQAWRESLASSLTMAEANWPDRQALIDQTAALVLSQNLHRRHLTGRQKA